MLGCRRTGDLCSCWGQAGCLLSPAGMPPVRQTLPLSPCGAGAPPR